MPCRDFAGECAVLAMIVHENDVVEIEYGCPFCGGSVREYLDPYTDELRGVTCLQCEYHLMYYGDDMKRKKGEHFDTFYRRFAKKWDTRY